MKRILIAGANPYNANKGVAALAVSSVKIIYDILSKQPGEFEICVYNHEFKKTFDTIETSDGSIPFLNIYPTDLFSLSNLLKTLFSRWRLYNLREFLKCDLVFNVAAGDGFSDIYGKKCFNSLTKINRLCRWFKKPYYFLPQTFGPFYDDRIRKKAALECQKAAGLMSRDSESSLYAQKYLGVRQINTLIDVAFCLPYSPRKRDCPNTHIGINISQTLCGSDNDHRFQKNPAYYLTIKEVVCRLLNDGYIVHLIPHVANTTNNDTNEYYISYNLWKEMQHPNLFLAPFFLSPSEAKSYISSMDLFLGARMHACIAAFSAGVPVLLLGYSRKFSGLFKDSLNYPYVLELASDFSVMSVMRIIQEMLNDLPKIKSYIQRQNELVVSPRIESLKHAIAEILNG